MAVVNYDSATGSLVKLLILTGMKAHFHNKTIMFQTLELHSRCSEAKHSHDELRLGCEIQICRIQLKPEGYVNERTCFYSVILVYDKIKTAGREEINRI